VKRWRPLLAILATLLSCINCGPSAIALAQLKPQDQPSTAGQPKADGVVFGRVLSAPGTIGRWAAPAPVGVGGQRVEILSLQSGQTVAHATSADDGSFRLTLRPGNYLLQAVGVKRYVRVDAGQEQEVNVMLAVP